MTSLNTDLQSKRVASKDTNLDKATRFFYVLEIMSHVFSRGGSMTTQMTEIETPTIFSSLDGLCIKRRECDQSTHRPLANVKTSGSIIPALWFLFISLAKPRLCSRYGLDLSGFKAPRRWKLSWLFSCVKKRHKALDPFYKLNRDASNSPDLGCLYFHLFHRSHGRLWQVSSNTRDHCMWLVSIKGLRHVSSITLWHTFWVLISRETLFSWEHFVLFLSPSRTKIPSNYDLTKWLDRENYKPLDGREYT